MLKNINIYIVFILTLGFLACSTDNEVDPLFDQDIDTRVDALLADYKKTLTDAEFGWKLVYQPKNSVGYYNIFLNFNEDNTVEIVSDYDLGAQDLATTFRVGKAHFPELVFENYSTFHNLFEISGFALEAEFEFIFEEVTADRVTFRSKTDTGDDITEIVFEKASAEEKERVISRRGSYEKITIGHLTSSFLRNIIVTDSNADATAAPLFQGTFAFDQLQRVVIITTFDETTGAINSTSYPASANENGFVLISPLQVNGIDIANFTFVEADNTFVSQDGEVNTIIGYDLGPVATGLVPSLFSSDVDTFGTRFTRYLYFDDTSRFFLRQTSPDFLYLLKSINTNRLDIRMNQFGPDVHGITFEGVNGENGPFTLAVSMTQVPGERVVFNFLGSTDPSLTGEVLSGLLLLIDGAGWYVQETNESPFATNPSFQLTSVSFPNFRFSIYGI